MRTLKQITEEMAAKQAHLHKAFEEAGPELDLSKVTSITGTNEEKAAEFKRLNTELSDLGKERDEAQELDDARKHTQKLGEWLNDPANAMTHPSPEAGDDKGDKPPVKSVGELFTESDAFKMYKGGDGPSAELKVGLKTVMSTGAGFAPETTRIGRLVEEALRPIQVLDLIPPGQTNQSAIVYMEETTATSGAAETAESAEGALASYGESAMAFTERNSPVRKIATFLPVTDEQLEDVEQIQSFINMRLGFFLRQRLDGQVLTGNGVAPNLTGILNVAGIQTQAKGADPVPDAIYKAMTLIRVTGRAMPTGVVLHPNDWQGVRLLRTADGIYIWGSPSEAAPERIWGLPVAQSDALTENTGLVGDLRAFCQLYERRGIEVKISDSHGDYFIQGVQAIRADMRVGFPVYRPAAFCTVTGI